jgi:ion channel-forming bestrophin family protein
MMVFEERPSWLQIVIHLRTSVLTRIWGRLLVTTLFALVVTEAFKFEVFEGIEKFSLSPLPFSLIGLALGIFLGFRNNTSYQRFWEGRILWGRLVNTSRSLTRQVLTLIQAPEGSEEALAAYQRSFVHHLAAYVHSLRYHLRGEKESYAELERLIPEDDLGALAGSSNPPIMLIQGMGQRATEAWRNGWLDTFHLPTLESSLTNLTDIQGGCERIKSTPIPFSYTILIHRIVAVYCLALPFGLVTVTHQATPLVVLLVSYAFFGLDAIGDEIENPFGLDDHDLPLDAMSTMIEVNVRDQLGETDLPALKTPVSNVLN